MRYAGFWKRFLATFVDGLILAVLLTITGEIIGFYYGALTGTTQGVDFIGQIDIIIIGWIYYASFESSERQATIGKMALGIKVIDMHGNRIGFGKATGRYFGKIISALIVFTGFLMVTYTEKKQGLHDIMAGCLVVNKLC